MVHFTLVLANSASMEFVRSTVSCILRHLPEDAPERLFRVTTICFQVTPTSRCRAPRRELCASPDTWTRSSRQLPWIRYQYLLTTAVRSCVYLRSILVQQ